MLLLSTILFLLVSLSVGDINDCCQYLGNDDTDKSTMMRCILNETVVQNRMIFDNKVPYSRGYHGPSYHVGIINITTPTPTSTTTTTTTTNTATNNC